MSLTPKGSFLSLKSSGLPVAGSYRNTHCILSQYPEAWTDLIFDLEELCTCGEMRCTGAKNNEDMRKIDLGIGQESALIIRYIMGRGIRYEFPNITISFADILFRIWNLLSCQGRTAAARSKH